MKIRIMSVDNGVGLTRDAAIITRILEGAGHHVEFSDYRKTHRMKADVQIFLELVNQTAFRQASKNYIIPNPEWYEQRWIGALPRCTAVLAKHQDTEMIFRKFTPRVLNIGFTSLDRHLEGIEKTPTFTHLPGKSSHKGTQQVIDAFSHDDMPPITIYHHHTNPHIWKTHGHPNVSLHFSRMADDAFQVMQNQHLFHVCPSQYEGFGHYINEAKSCGSIVIGTAAPFMLELLNDCGVGVPCTPMQKHNLATLQLPSIQGIRDAVMMLTNDLTEESCRILAAKSRDSYLKQKAKFETELIKIIERP